MYLDLGEDLKKDILECTDVDYDFVGYMINADDLKDVLKDLIYEIHKRDEIIKSQKEDIQRLDFELMFGANRDNN